MQENSNNCCIVIGNAPIGDYEAVKAGLSADAFVVCCDGGLKHLTKLGLTPSLIVGDFDSHEKPNTDTETIVLPREKDDTDGFFAIKTAYERGFRHFTLAGFFGGRFDHSLVNISAMIWLHNRGCSCSGIDDYSEMQLVGSDEVSIDSSFPYFSLLTVNGSAQGVTIKGAKYPLTDATILPEYQYGISNEVLPGNTASVSVKEGLLLLIKVRNDA